MGNRGTTPNWDDEQISKYGIFGHFRMVSAPARAERARRDAKLVEENIGQVLSLLNDTSLDTLVRATYAIPCLAKSLLLPEDLRLKNWRELVAREIYEDWFQNTKQWGPAPPFEILSTEDQEPFYKVVEATVEALRMEVTMAELRGACE
ncbi:hypothetical protein KW790_03225 [Candidatus Parcubacteria bacterium]|nr:hypothetical protein [Candidatus Parcubacteria bacterium]